MRITVLAIALLAMAVPAAANAAAPRFLPPAEKGLSVAQPAKRTCAAGLMRPGARGVARHSYTAPMSGFVNVRLTGARGDWDLAVFDARTKGLLASSQSFGRKELAQTWVASAQKLTIQACRRSGSRSRGTVSIGFVDLAPPKSVGTPQLLRVEVGGGADVHRLEGLGVDVTHQVHDGHADVIVSGADQVAALTKAGFRFKKVIADMNRHFAESRRADLAFARRVSNRSGLPSGRTGYRNLLAYQTEMKALAAAHPGRIRPVTLPKQTTQGRPIEGLEIASDVERTDDGRPTWFVVALHHAREWPSAEIAMELAHMLAKEYGTNARVTQLVDRARIVIVPLINVDSFVFTQQAVSPADTVWYGKDTPPQLRPQGKNLYTVEQALGAQAYRRKTCSGAFPAGAPCEVQWGTDPNRNYAEGWGGVGASSQPTDLTYRGRGPWSEPETQAVHEFSQKRQVTNIITIHNVAALVLRPPGRRSDGLAPDEKRMKEIGDAMADATGYRSQYGWQLYDTSGTTEDWNYAAQGAFGYTIEVGPGGTRTDTPENYDADSAFHMPYEKGVVREWTGWGPNEGQGLREALLIAGESAVNPADHSIIEGTAPAGRVLRLRKEFNTETSPVCTATVSFPVRFLNPPLSAITTDKCLAPGDRIAIKDHLDTTMTVPESETFEWHVNPSTRPFKRFKYVPAGGERILSSEEFRQAAGERTEPYVKDSDEVPDVANTPDVEAPGTLESPQPKHYVERSFTVGADETADRIRVRLDWPTKTHEDYDLYLVRKTADGGEVPAGVGTGPGVSGHAPPDAEEIIVNKPEAGTYVLRVVNYLASDPNWVAKVERLDVEEEHYVEGERESWKLSCESAGGKVFGDTEVFVDRGQRVQVDLAGICKKSKKPKSHGRDG